MGAKNLKPFKKGQSGNPNGRPPKIATSVIRSLKERGVDRVSRAEIDELIGRLQNLPRKELVELANADDTPMVVALIARGMAGAKGHEFLVRDLWDRQHGRPKQEVKVEEAGEVRHVITFRRGDKASSNPGEV